MTGRIGQDALAALGLLTRIPVPFATPRANGAWAWPLAGLAVGMVLALMAAPAEWLGLAPAFAAILVLATGAVLTGGLHEDGLADCADGFWGGRGRARRLAIMKDSRIGSYGMLALVLVLMMRWQALTMILEHDAWQSLIAAAILSRAPMAALAAALPNARGDGLSQSIGRPDRRTALRGIGLALILALVLAGGAGLAMALWAGLAALAVALVARAKIGGQTGDVLGASQQLAEAAALTTAATLLT